MNSTPNTGGEEVSDDLKKEKIFKNIFRTPLLRGECALSRVNLSF